VSKRNDFGDHVATPLGEQLAADVFDFGGAEAADFFYDGEWSAKLVPPRE